ncbi:MAG: FMN-dependent NADH-azoreductase [Rhodobacteraceae bacterium]|nr:FMN-dependent NADH-azoreductase [Paracoccaceae bacterium]
MNVLRLDASPQTDSSQSRALTDRLIAGLGPDIRVTTRDLATPPAHIDAAWVRANGTPAEDRTADQRQVLALSDTLVAEIDQADLLVFGLPVYNFSVPIGLRAWIDQICRARLTFTYADGQQVGLMTGKRAVVVYASGGTEMGSDIDFASGYLRHILGFIGVHDVEFVNADRLMFDPEKPAQAGQEADRIAADLRQTLVA